MNVSPETRAQALEFAATEKCDLYVWNGPVNEEALGALVEDSFYEHPDGVLILATFGGSANSAYRASRFFQTVYRNFTVVVPSYCKSAGTLIVLGANKLIMTEFGELGPLDVQLVMRDEIGERRSGLLLRSALTHLNEHSMKLFSHLMLSIKGSSKGLIRFKLASELSAQMTEGLLSQVYSQLSPETLGQDYQDLMVAFEYGKRLAQVGGLIDEDEIYELVHGYPSHDFVIDRQEAQSIFKSVDEPSKTMYKLLASLGPLAWLPQGKQVSVFALSKPDKKESAGDEGSGEAGEGLASSVDGLRDGDRDRPSEED